MTSKRAATIQSACWACLLAAILGGLTIACQQR